ncbi:ABC transporter permease [Secundilactobacillus malefermentans]|uniref:ABC transmembrane type-2 domain-containing protein n=1 Tax=Secundilactobacillus malefermentans TaxID=176292 RepID=A0A4R5NS41_9LACO|nr:ABC transporter permease [Secundilactobacillus malefermentans]QEA31711.1 ABC transporter permease [Secundilactobacillus malefermentans]TDG79948.1 hypothetical protein C5L31_002167 [Secundilactobacillus malefermentans]
MRISAMIRRVLKEMIRDKRTLALMMIAPLFILTLVYFLFQSNNNQTATLGVRNVDSSLVKAVKNDNLKVRQITSDKSAKSIIRDKDYAGVLTQKDQKLTLTLQNSDQTKSGLLKKSLQQAQVKLKMQAAASGLKAQKEVIAAQAKALKAIQETMGAGAQNSGVKAPASLKAAKASAYSVNTHYLYGSSDSTFFDTILPIMIGFVVFFFVFLISGIALLKERTTGTLNRLLATPIKRGEIIAGYLSGYGIFAFIQTVVIVLYTMYVFKIQILGSVWYVILINILLAFVALALGLLISTFAASEFQMVQFIPIVVIPQIFFSGIVPLDQMASWLRPIAHIMPLYYGAQSMSDVITKGAGFFDIWGDLLVLVGFAALFLILNLLTMRKYRQV